MLLLSCTPRRWKARGGPVMPSRSLARVPLLALATLLGLGLALAACGADGGVPSPEPAGEGGALEPLSAPQLPCEDAEVRSGDPRTPIGFNDASFAEGWGSLEDSMALHRAAGSTLVRYSADWRQVEPQPGRLQLARWDALYCAAVEAGVRPLITLAGAPDWAVDADMPCPGEPCLRPPLPDYLPHFARYARLMTERYPEAAAFQVWNEPNFFRYFGTPDPERYTELLEAAYKGAKQGDENATVLGGALTNNPEDEPDTGNISLRNFLSSMYAAGAAESMDALALHAYPIVPLDDPREQMTPSLELVRELGEGEPASARRIWVTEVGIPTEPGEPWSPGVEEEVQTETILEALDSLERAPDVRAIIFHALLEAPGREAGFSWAMRDPDDGAGYNPKQVMCRVAQRREAPGCSAPIFRRGGP